MKKHYFISTVFFLLLFVFSWQQLYSQSLTANISVNDYQWLNSNGQPIDFSQRFPGASLTRHYAPLPVFFQGWESTPRNAIVDYTWNFGDNSPEYHGFNAGYVYETPGNYTARLTVTDTAGNTATTTINIEVLARNGTNYYVDSQIGNDTYDGKSQTYLGGNHGPWKTANKAFTETTTTLYQPGDCILFKRGQTFELSISEITPSAWPAWGYMMGTYGNGAKPIIQYSGPDNAIVFHFYSIGLAHIALVDLDFRFDDHAGHRAGVFFFAQGGGTRNILFLRVESLDLYSDFFVIGNYLPEETSTGTFCVNSNIRITNINVEKSNGLFAIYGSRFVCLNNNFDFSGNHVAYTSLDKGVIAGNTFSKPAFGRTALRICGFGHSTSEWNTNLTSNNVQISDNFFHGWIDPETVGNAHNGGGNRYNYLLVQLAPNGPWNQIIRDINFERNVITNGEGMLAIGSAENITVRNNILISNAMQEGNVSYLISVIDANKPSKNINIIGNTLIARNTQYTGNPYSDVGMIKILNNETQVSHPFGYTNHQNINIKNNIFYSYGENQGTRFIFIDNISDVLPQVNSNNNLFFVSNGSNDGQFFQIGNVYDANIQRLTLNEWQNQQNRDINSIFGNPQFVNLLGADGAFSNYGFDANLNLTTTSPARNIGNVDKLNSYYDFNLYKRINDNNTVDIGAYEYHSTVEPPPPPAKTQVISIKRANNAAEYTNADTIIFTVTLAQNSNYTPITTDFIVKNGDMIADNPISGNAANWTVKIATNENSGYDTAKQVSIELSNTSKLQATTNMINESYSVRKKFTAQVDFISPTNTDVNLNDSGKVVFNEDGIIINADINSPIIISGGNGHAQIKNYVVKDIDPNDHKTELIFTYSDITNATTYILSFTENAFKDMWGNLSGKLDQETKFNTVKAFVKTIERLQPVIERTNADTLTFKLTLENVVNYTPKKSDFSFQNCNLVQNNGIVGSGSEWQIKVLTNVSDGYDSAKLVTIHLLPEGNFYSVKSFKPQNYSVRKKFVSKAVLESPSGDSVAINGTDGKIIFTEKDISLSTVTPTLTLSGGIGTVSELKILEEEKSTSLLFSYSGLSNSTQYSLVFSANALKDSWGNLSADLSLSSNVFTTCKEVGINSDLSLFSLSNQPNPFVHTTFITWSSSIAADTKIIVFDITGKLVRILLDEYRLAGEHSLVFDSKGLEPGIYYYQIQIGKEVSAKKMMIIE